MNLHIERVTFNCSQVCSDALAVFNGQYINVGPAVMVFGFNSHGIVFNGTGGGYIHHSWLGEIAPD